jgi:hypothetical protein
VELYLHSPNTPSWRDAQKHRDNFTFTFTLKSIHVLYMAHVSRVENHWCRLRGCGLDSYGSGKSVVAGTCERSNELPGSIEVTECQLLKRGSVALSYKQTHTHTHRHVS